MNINEYFETEKEIIWFLNHELIKGIEGNIVVKDVKKQPKVSDKPIVKDEKMFLNSSHKDYVPMNEFFMQYRVHKDEFQYHHMIQREKEWLNKDKNKKDEFQLTDKLKEKAKEKESDSFELEQRYIENKRPKIKMRADEKWE